MNTTTCPRCGDEHCHVREVFRQATRTEPMLSLGFQGYCRQCDVNFRVTAPLVQEAFV